MKLSILVASRNRHKLLHNCIENILGQTLHDIELIVLDDCSSERRPYDLLRESLYPKGIRFYRSEFPLGVAGGRNFLIQKSSGNILCIIDDDAVFEDKTCAERIIETFARRPEVGILALKIINHSNGRRELYVPFSKWSRWRNPSLTESANYVSYFLGTCHAMRRSVYETCGGFRSDLVYGEEELDLSFRAVSKGFKILFDPSIVVHHYPAPSAISRTNRKNQESSELYYHVRNRLMLAYKYLPTRYIVIYVSIWMARYALEAVKERSLGQYFRGLRDGFEALIDLERIQLSPETIQYLKSHHGRLWY